MTEYAILPLGSQYIHERAPYVKSVLLYGAEKTGKTLLTHVSVVAAWGVGLKGAAVGGGEDGQGTPLCVSVVRVTLKCFHRCVTFQT